jgi:predicted SPOUT superfamily RNA methylase MTH1
MNANILSAPKSELLEYENILECLESDLGKRGRVNCGDEQTNWVSESGTANERVIVRIQAIEYESKQINGQVRS